MVKGKDIISFYCKCGNRVCSQCGGPNCNCSDCKNSIHSTKI